MPSLLTLPEVSAILMEALIGITVMVIDITSLHPPTVTVTVYMVVVAGETTMLGVDSPVLHEYVPPPVAVKVADDPAQIILSLLATPEFSVAVSVRAVLANSSAPISGFTASRGSQSISIVTGTGNPPASRHKFVEETRCKSVADTKFGCTETEFRSRPVSVCQLARVVLEIPATTPPVIPTWYVPGPAPAAYRSL